MTENQTRAAFLAGEGTLTAGEVRRWAQELNRAQGLPILPGGMTDAEPLMVSIVPPQDRRGLTGAQVL